MPLTSTPRFLNGSKTIPGSFSTSLRRQPPGSTPSRASLRNSPKSASGAACSAPSRNSKMPSTASSTTPMQTQSPLPGPRTPTKSSLELRHRHGDVVFSHSEKAAGIDDRVRNRLVEGDNNVIDRSDPLTQVVVDRRPEDLPLRAPTQSNIAHFRVTAAEERRSGDLRM